MFTIRIFINYKSHSKLNTAYEINKQYINTNYLENTLICYIKGTSINIALNQVKGKLVDLPSLLLRN